MLRDLQYLSRHSLLLSTLVTRELKARYRSSALGFFWSLLNPLILLLVYALVFSFYLRSGTQDYAAFLASGLLPWLWFSSSLGEATGSIVHGANLVNKALFPAEILPMVSVISNLIHFLLGMLVLVVFLLGYARPPSFLLLTLPLLLLVQGLFTAALAMILATVNVFFRDVQQIVGHALTLWFFLSPIVYEISQVPNEFKWTLSVNPMALLIEGYQGIFFYHQFPPHYFSNLSLLLIFSIVLLWVGHKIFSYVKDEFVEQI